MLVWPSINGNWTSAVTRLAPDWSHAAFRIFFTAGRARTDVDTVRGGEEQNLQ